MVISDSFGRAWRLGQVDVAIGCAGLAPLHDLRGDARRAGPELTAPMDPSPMRRPRAAALVRHKAGRRSGRGRARAGAPRHRRRRPGRGRDRAPRRPRTSSAEIGSRGSGHEHGGAAQLAAFSRVSASSRAFERNTSTSVCTGTSRREREELVGRPRASGSRRSVATRSPQRRSYREPGSATCGSRRTRRPRPFAPRRSARGTSSPAGAKMITLSSSTGRSLVARSRPRGAELEREPRVRSRRACTA